MVFIYDPSIPPAPGSRRAPLIALQILFILIALSVYSLRVYTRAFILRSIASDDFIMGLALLVSIGLAINACISTTYGWGTHVSAINPANYGHILFTIWLSELLFTISTSLAKISILLFYLRIAVTKTYRIVIWCSIGFIAVWLITFAAVIIFQCQPVSEYWDPAGTRCYNPEVAFFIHGLTNTITDIYVYVLPMKMVWQIQLPKRQRIGLMAIFGAGFLVCVAGAVRLYFSIVTQTNADTPWVGYYLWTWEAIEINLGIVCASAPCLKALVTRIVPRLFPSQTGSKGTFVSGEENTLRGGMNGNGKGGYILHSVQKPRDGKARRDGGESQDDLTV